MRHRIQACLLCAVGLLALTAGTPPSSPTAHEIVAQLLEADPFGFGGAAVSARLVLKGKAGVESQLAFTSRSMRYDGPFSKSLVRFTAPADMAGAGFLQIQNRGSDDDRYVFLPDLKRSRRIAGGSRSSSFMGTDFSFADLDRRDFREGELSSQPDEQIGKHACYRIDVAPTRSDSPYSKLEASVRKDNLLPLKLVMHDRAKALVKTFTAQEVRRVDGAWFITKSRMLDHGTGHSTELLLDAVTPLKDASDAEFSVRNLEKI